MSRRLLSDRRGTTLIESAFVFLPFIALLLATFDYSVMIFLRGTFLHAVREGARFGITNRLAPGYGGHKSSIKSVVQANSFGFLTGTHAGTPNIDRIEVRYYNPATLTEVSVNQPGYVLEVSVVNYPAVWIAPLMHEQYGLVLQARSSSILEAPPGGILPPVNP